MVENYRKGSLARLGLGYDEVRKRRPDLIYASLNAFGYDGPWAGRPGWEQLAQAATGIQTRRGGRDAAPQLLPYPMNDYATGLLGAYSVALALNERQRTGLGQQVDGGLALTAGLLQSPYFLDFKDHQRAEPEGLDLRGHSALSRLYQAADGWLCLHCPDNAAWDELTRLPDFAPLADDARFAAAPSRRQNDAALCAALSPILSANPRRHWIHLLQPTAVSVIEKPRHPRFPQRPARPPSRTGSQPRASWNGPSRPLGPNPPTVGHPRPAGPSHPDPGRRNRRNPSRNRLHRNGNSNPESRRRGSRNLTGSAAATPTGPRRQRGPPTPNIPAPQHPRQPPSAAAFPPSPSPPANRLGHRLGGIKS